MTRHRAPKWNSSVPLVASLLSIAFASFVARAIASTEVRYEGTIETLNITCASGGSTTRVAIATRAWPGDAVACAYAPATFASAAERAEANETLALRAFDADRDNAEYYVANLIGIDDAAVAIAVGKNATSYAAYANARAASANARAALDEAVRLAEWSIAVDLGGTGGNKTYACDVSVTKGGLYAVVVRSAESGGTIRATSPSSAKTIRLTALNAYGPRSGPSIGGTKVTFYGAGFNDVPNKKMNCTILDGNFLRVQTATHEADGTVTCETPAQSGVVDINLVYPDSCTEKVKFLYYQNPEPLLLTNKKFPRFGPSNFTVYSSNTYFANEFAANGADPVYRGMVNITCAIGMGTSAIQTAAAVAVFPGVMAASGLAIICMKPDDVIPAGTHDVRVSFNGQQYSLAALLLTEPDKVSITAYGPVARVKHHISEEQNVVEGARVIKVPVQLQGENKRLASVGINVTYGGASPLPGSTGDLALVQVQHAAARDNATGGVGDYDFSVYPLTLHWMAGDTADAFVYVRVVNDDIHEADLEALTLTLVNPQNCDIETDVKNQTAVVTIRDDDLAPMFAVRARTVIYPPLYRDMRAVARIPVDMIAGGRFVLPAIVQYTTAVGTSSQSARAGVHFVNVTRQIIWTSEQFGETKYAEVELDWSRIPLVANLRLNIELEAVSDARVALPRAAYNETEDAAAFIYGVPQGSCPPGTRRIDPAAWVAPPPLAPMSPPPPPPPPPPASYVDSAILRLSVVVNSTAATTNVFAVVPLGISLAPEFDPAIYVYTGIVPSYAVGVQIYYQFRQASTTSATTQARRRLLAASTVSMKYFKLQTGANTIRFATTSPNGQHNEQYTIVITRLALQPTPSSPPPSPPSLPPPPLPPPWNKPPPPAPEAEYPPPPAPPAPPVQAAVPFAPEDDPVCTRCPAGTFTPDMNALECLPCPIGSVSPNSTSEACVPCQPGEYMHHAEGLTCLKCPMDTFVNSTRARLCVPCSASATTTSVGSASCAVPIFPVPKQDPAVFYVDVAFGVSFHQTSGTLANVAQNVGVDLSDIDAFRRALEIDIALRFNITRGAMQVSSIATGSTVPAPTRRRSMLQSTTIDASGALICSASDDCVGAAAVKLTMQATTVPRYGVVRDYATNVAAIEATRVKAQELLNSLQSDPLAFFATTSAGIGGAVVSRAYVNATGALVIDKVPDPPRVVPDVFGPVNVAMIAIGVVLGACGLVVVYIVYRRWRTKRAKARVEKEPAKKPPTEPKGPKERWSAHSNRAMDLELGVEREEKPSEIPSAIQMRDSSTAALAQLAKFKMRRGQTHVESMWASRAKPAASIGVRANLGRPAKNIK